MCWFIIYSRYEEWTDSCDFLCIFSYCSIRPIVELDKDLEEYRYTLLSFSLHKNFEKQLAIIILIYYIVMKDFCKYICCWCCYREKYSIDTEAYIDWNNEMYGAVIHNK